MKSKIIILTLLIMALVFTGCGKKNNTSGSTSPSPAATTAPTTAATTAPTTAASPSAAATSPTAAPAADTTTSASIVSTADDFIKAASAQGTWIVAITKDVVTDKDIVVEGEFKNGKKDTAGNDIIQRKIALYSQDANRNITARFTLQAPKLTFNSPEGSLQHGTFIGDLYIGAKDFQLIDNTVVGNVYFTTDEAKSTFTMDKTSKITGKQELKK